MTEIDPFFALEAEQLLMAGFPEDAIELCQKGLIEYPGYTAAIAVLARAFHTLGHKDKSIDLIDSSITNLPKSNLLYKLKENLDTQSYSVDNKTDSSPDMSDNLEDEPSNDDINAMFEQQEDIQEEPSNDDINALFEQQEDIQEEPSNDDINALFEQQEDIQEEPSNDDINALFEQQEDIQEESSNDDINTLFEQQEDIQEEPSNDDINALFEQQEDIQEEPSNDDINALFEQQEDIQEEPSNDDINALFEQQEDIQEEPSNDDINALFEQQEDIQEEPSSDDINTLFEQQEDIQEEPSNENIFPDTEEVVEDENTDDDLDSILANFADKSIIKPATENPTVSTETNSKTFADDSHIFNIKSSQPAQRGINKSLPQFPQDNMLEEIYSSSSDLSEQYNLAELARIANEINEEDSYYNTADDDQEEITVIANDSMLIVYEKQGAYEAAIQVCEIMADRNPSKAQFYKDKITELRSKLQQC